MYLSRVRQLATERGLTRQDLAALTGYSINTVNRWWWNTPSIQRADAVKVKRFQSIFELACWYEVFEPFL